MYHYKVKISYRGTCYFGWQSQPNESYETVHATIHQVLKKISKYEECNLSGASRTDAGVHASGQVAKISIPKEIDADKLLLGMNSLLPEDIRIVECNRCDVSFNANRDSKTKEYHYYFSISEIENPLLSQIVASVDKSMDIELMNNASKVFIGEHDFYNFSRRDGKSLSTIRTITECEIIKANFLPLDSEVYYLKIIGTGFLKQMIRYIAGSLFLVGQNKKSVEDLISFLNNKQDKKLGAKAKARGLHLVQINY